MAWTPDMAAAHALPCVRPFVAISLVVGEETARWLVGGGQVTFGGFTYKSRDAAYGVIEKVETVSETVGSSAPNLRFTILPPSLGAAGDLSASSQQNKRLIVYYGALDIVTGAVVPDPDIVFYGRVDVPYFLNDKGKKSVEIDAVSEWDLLFDADEGFSLNDAFHQTVFPGERGFEYVTEVDRQLPWGAEGPKPSITTASSAGLTSDPFGSMGTGSVTGIGG